MNYQGNTFEMIAFLSLCFVFVAFMITLFIHYCTYHYLYMLYSHFILSCNAQLFTSSAVLAGKVILNLQLVPKSRGSSTLFDNFLYDL